MSDGLSAQVPEFLSSSLRATSEYLSALQMPKYFLSALNV